MILAFFLVPYYINKYHLSDQKLARTGVGHLYVYHYPMFVFGVILADLEMQEPRPLDWLRNLSLAGSIVKNTILLFLFVSFGSYKMDCHWKDEGPCDYWKVVSINGAIPKDLALYIAGLAIILLALTSKVT